jgi:hypothetical protein
VAHSFVRELLKTLVTLTMAAASVMVGFPLALLGLIALTGSLVDASFAANVSAGLLLIATAALIWMIAGYWLRWCAGRIGARRFSMRKMLIGVTLATIYMGLIATCMSQY